MRNLGYPTTEEWSAWTYGDNGAYVGGYKTVYNAPNALTFLTVKDSGHMVDTYPVRRLHRTRAAVRLGGRSRA